MELRRVTVDNTIKANANMAAFDGVTHKLVFLSVLGYDAAIKKLVKEINRKTTVYVERFGNYGTGYKEYDVKRHKDQATDYGHTVISIKDQVDVSESGVVSLRGYVYAELTAEEFNLRAATHERGEIHEDLINLVHDKLSQHMPVAIIEEWKDYVVEQVFRNRLVDEIRVFKDENDKLRVFKVSIDSNQLSNIIQNGLQRREISIMGTNTVSEEMAEVTGMDSYLNAFSVPTANKLEDLFTPKFIPGQSEYNENMQTFIDYAEYKGISLYEPQKIVVQSTSNNLDKNNVSFIIARPGSGKTIMGAAAVYANAKKPNTTNIVLCPGHLVEKWAAEITKYTPLSEAIVVDDFAHFKSLEPKINDRRRRKHLFLVISTSTAKTTYEKRPAVIWSSAKKSYCCPKCGQKLLKKEFAGTGRNRYEYYRDLTELDFTKEYAFNQVCDREVRYWNKESRRWDTRPCHEPLWTPFMKEEGGDRWIRLPRSQGWIEKIHMNKLFDELVVRTDLDRNESRLLSALSEAIQTEEDGTTIVRAPRKYSLANYIRRFYKGKIDYLLADELHQYKGGNSQQGQAFGDLVNSARKIIGLTGTLLNGYADSLFYILYRTYPQLMKAEGFDYNDEKEFARTFGVVRSMNRFNMNAAGNPTTRVGSGSEKFLPGVSPLVFTKFLLENAVFLNLEDISDDLPNYEEILIAVAMDEDLQQAYEELERELRSNIGWGSGGSKIMGSMLQALSAYPDMPYDQPAVIHPDTGQTVVTLNDLPVFERTKETETVRLCRERVAAGDKVLLYYHWTNRTNVAERMTELLEAAGLRVTVLSSNSSSTRDREAWIKERTPETDVLICNPTLVETGLDLLDYTSIIFYQVGYNIFTMRQASKRSYRLNQTKDVKVYFVYYQDTVQEQALSLMATKLQASQAIEGDFSEEGLHAMSNNEDLLTQIANSVVKNIKHTVDIDVFAGTKERTIHTDLDTENMPFDTIFSEVPDAKREVVAEFIDNKVIRIEFRTYSLKDSLVNKTKKCKKKKIAAQVTATQSNTNKLMFMLRNKQTHIANLL
ncbi:hypothetical protein FC756_24340 [Lysinibacillus mangiferihumi]|uniref:Helicase C-terminal domain-containing protein n=1 Tax=Lysinibacillus mangiferihumi TaxID=1130819 RepID=A0A4U2XZD3_9BACI|nr:DEAD/DEAH box helicase family protein [Lysinibacillus mangiferihumi]TKI53340.1 hypothetical protein FC756_24340 [Lysinibacillus mangiferihumi]